MVRVLLVTLATALLYPTHAQVRVITGDTEHIEGRGGVIMDDEALQEKNARAANKPKERRAVAPIWSPIDDHLLGITPPVVGLDAPTGRTVPPRR